MFFPPQNIVRNWEGYYNSETDVGKGTHCGSPARCVWRTAASPRDAHAGGGFMAGANGGEIWGNRCSCCMVRGESLGNKKKIKQDKEMPICCAVVFFRGTRWDGAVLPTRSLHEAGGMGAGMHFQCRDASCTHLLSGCQLAGASRGENQNNMSVCSCCCWVPGWGLGLSSRTGREHISISMFWLQEPQVSAGRCGGWANGHCCFEFT